MTGGRWIGYGRKRKERERGRENQNWGEERSHIAATFSKEKEGGQREGRLEARSACLSGGRERAVLSLKGTEQTITFPSLFDNIKIGS